MPSRTRLIIGGALVALGLLGIANAPGGTGWWPHGGPMMGGRGAAAPPTVPEAEIVEIRATELRFDPNRIVVAIGDSVNIRFINDGIVFHDLSIPALGFHIGAEPTQEATGGLTPSTPGEHQFRCTVPGHAAAGMTGALVVTEAAPQD